MFQNLQVYQELVHNNLLLLKQFGDNSKNISINTILDIKLTLTNNKLKHLLFKFFMKLLKENLIMSFGIYLELILMETDKYNSNNL